jgi:hypothetical protein
MHVILHASIVPFHARVPQKSAYVREEINIRPDNETSLPVLNFTMPSVAATAEKAQQEPAATMHV